MTAQHPPAPGRVRWTPRSVATPAERAAAAVIDAGIIWSLWVGGMIWMVETGQLGATPRLLALRAWLWTLIAWGVWLVYEAGATHLFGSTVGRRVAGVEVRAASGELPTARAALLRALARTPSLLLLGVGLVPLWSDAQRRTLHDRAAGTAVVRCDAVEPATGDRAGGLATVETPADRDAGEIAIRCAGLPGRQAGWLRAVADQIALRLDIADPSWRRAEDPLALRHRAFCLLLARLARRHPEQRPAITRVLECHDALAAVDGDRLAFLAGLLDDRPRARRWIGLADGARLHVVLDEPAPGS